jgi:hypothetical protein
MIEQPVVRGLAPVRRDDPKGIFGDFPDDSPEAGLGGRRHGPGPRRGVDAAAPEDFVGHPVSDSGEEILVEKERLDGGGGVPLQDGGEARPGEQGGEDSGWQLRPPAGEFAPEVELDPSEHARVMEDEGAFRQPEKQVVVAILNVVAGFCAQLTAHAEVKPEPSGGSEAEEHLFSVGEGTMKGGAAELAQRIGGNVHPAEDPGLGMEADIHHG